MAGHHRVAVAGHEDLQAPHVGLVHLGRVLEGDRLGLLVGALAQAHPAARDGQVTAVGLGAVQVGLQHRPDRREVLAQLAQGLQRRVGGGVVLHVEGHRGARVGGRLADLAGVVEGDLVPVTGEVLAHRAQLDADLGAAALGEAGLGHRAEQLDVGVTGGARLVEVGGVLAEEVDGAEPAGLGQRGRGTHRVGGALTGDEPADHVPAHRCLLDQVADLVAPRELQQSLAQHGARIHHVFLRQ